MTNSTSSTTERRTLSGRRIVIGMFVFALAAVSGMWVYWKMHIAPFLPLQQALAAKFEDSSPRVEGGQRKIHQGTPKILRITMKVEFDPTQTTKTRDDFIDRVAAFVPTQHDLSRYQDFELHLFQPVPEKKIRQEVFSFSTSKLPLERSTD